MKNFSSMDGLVLCVARGRIDVEDWISTIDYLDRIFISYEELSDALEHLQKGKLITLKKNRFALSAKARLILFGKWLMSDIGWQLAVRDRIVHYCYDENETAEYQLNQNDYEMAKNNYLKRMGVSFE